MNKVILVGRLTRDPDVRYSTGETPTAVARFTLAVERRFAKRDGSQPTADFISCVAFGRNGEFVEKYFRQGMRVAVSGRIQTGSYTDRDGKKVYTTDIVMEEQEFAETKSEYENHVTGRSNSGGGRLNAGNYTGADGFMNIPDGIDDELPFH